MGCCERGGPGGLSPRGGRAFGESLELLSRHQVDTEIAETWTRISFFLGDRSSLTGL